MVWDTIEVLYNKIPYFQSQPPCQPLQSADMKDARPPVKVLVGTTYEREGGFNAVTDAWILSEDGSSGCRCLLRQSLDGAGYTEDDLHTVLHLAEEGIHPPVYALNHRYMVMEMYNSDLYAFLENAGEARAFATLDMAYTVICKLARQNILCTDIKPRNIVVKSDWGQVKDVRLIDVDGEFRHLFEQNGSVKDTDYMAKAFAMIYHLILHLNSMRGKNAINISKLVNSALEYATIANGTDAVKESFEEALKLHNGPFEHYFRIYPVNNTFQNAVNKLNSMQNHSAAMQPRLPPLPPSPSRPRRSPLPSLDDGVYEFTSKTPSWWPRQSSTSLTTSRSSLSSREDSAVGDRSESSR
jgi:hypothetical protein